MKKKNQILEQLVFVFFSISMYSQISYVPENIKTIIFKSSNTNDSFLNYGDQFELSFDDLDSDEKNYYYQINHFDYEWAYSNLSKSEFLNGFVLFRLIWETVQEPHINRAIHPPIATGSPARLAYIGIRDKGMIAIIGDKAQR